MAIAAQQAPAGLLTYEQYLAEEEINRRYDILEGVRVFMANPTRQHQDILFNTATPLRDFGRASGIGKTILAPCDLLIERDPLRTRQPDVLFISHAQLAKCGPDTDPAPLAAAPELVVEILSPTETRKLRDDKIKDYCAIGVRECWVLNPKTKTVEVLRLTPQGAETVAVYHAGQTLRSDLYPDLALPVAGLFV